LAETKKVRECEGGQREADGAALHPRLPLSSSSPRLLRFHSVPSFHSATTPLALGRTHTHTHTHTAAAVPAREHGNMTSCWHSTGGNACSCCFRWSARCIDPTRRNATAVVLALVVVAGSQDASTPHPTQCDASVFISNERRRANGRRPAALRRALLARVRRPRRRRHCRLPHP
jgi:hypothetical protein